ncbi:MAG: hypothetical protein ACQUHE_08640 [Bacteroidia bacterium]
MKKLLFLSLFMFLFSCTKTETDEHFNPSSTANKLLLLKIDYLTNKFEGGKELTFQSSTPTFSIETIYQIPGDFGNIKFVYKELHQPLFDGSIVWAGKGEMKFPTNWIAPKHFESADTFDVIYPNRFENIFNPNNQTYDYTKLWLKVQQYQKVRAYIMSNPNASVKLFLYTPSVGVGNPADWDWIMMLKN